MGGGGGHHRIVKNVIGLQIDEMAGNHCSLVCYSINGTYFGHVFTFVSRTKVCDD